MAYAAATGYHGRVTQSSPLGVPECLDCGTCCFSQLPEYARVFGSDHERLGEHADALTHFIGNQCYMRLVDGHCAALKIDPDTRRYACSVYALRPDVCHQLERGSRSCRAEIHEKGERPLIAVNELLARRNAGLIPPT